MKKLYLLFIFLTVSSIANAQTPGNFIAFGTEPFWNLEITSETITFELNGETETYRYVDPYTAVGFTTDYIKIYYIDKKANIVLVVKDEKTTCGCTDGISDTIYQFEVYLFKGDVMYYGCGRIME